MNRETAKQLCQITRDFYRSQAPSFSETRRSAWPGWRRVAAEVGGHMVAAVEGEGTLDVLDVACGNLRFESFLTDALPQARLRFHAVDNCEELVRAEGGTAGVRVGESAGVSGSACVAMGADEGAGTREDVGARTTICEDAARGVVIHEGADSRSSVCFYRFDVASALLADGDAPALPQVPSCDLSVSFGFMHHVPSWDARVRLLRALVDGTRPGGLLAVSFWCFTRDAGLAERACTAQELALAELNLDATCLDAGDFVLGWRGVPHAWRYCHAFDTDEVDRLVAAVGPHAVPLVRFASDGRTGALNEYVIMQVM